MDHTYRCSKYGFRKNTIESDKAPIRLTSQQIQDKVRRLLNITKVGKSIRLLGYEVEHNQNKQNIFWELPYWKGHLVHDYLDVMHVEKNVFDNIIHTVLNNDQAKDTKKSKDGFRGVLQTS